MLGFNVRIEGGITEIGLAAVARKIAAILIVSGPSLPLLFTTFVCIVFVPF